MYLLDHQATAVNLNEEEPPSSLNIQLSNTSKLSRTRSKTTGTDSSDADSTTNNSSQVSISTPSNINFFQSIKDLTYQELYRANPIGFLGKEVITATGTTHCPEPIPPEDEDDKNGHIHYPSSKKLSAIDENKPQQVHFPLNKEEKLEMLRRRSTSANISENMLPPFPVEYGSNSNDSHVQMQLFSQPSPHTMVADFIPDTMTINVFEVFIYAWGVFAFFFDMVTDLVLAHAYYSEGAYWLFILTLMCVVLPNLTLSIFSLVWYIDSSQLKAAANEKETKAQYSMSSEDYLGKDQQQTSRRSELTSGNQKENFYPRKNDYQKDLQQQDSMKDKYFQISTATANILTWIIRIIILVLQLDLCLK